jgi:co-chaperonin GroES (HSP10)
MERRSKEGVDLWVGYCKNWLQYCKIIQIKINQHCKGGAMNIKSTTEIYCVGTRVLVKVQKIEDKSAGGIVLPQRHVEMEQDVVSEGQIVDYGMLAFDGVCEKEEIPPKGAYVYFVKFAGKGITVNEEEYRIINDEDIYAIRKQTEGVD